MKLIKKMTAMLMASVLVLSLAACSGGGATAAKDPVLAATEKMAAVKSMDSTMVMDMNMTVADQAMTSTTTMNMTMFTDPMKLKADVNIEAMGQSQAMSMYFEGEKDSYTMYVTDGTVWQSQAATMEDIGQYDVKASMGEYMSLSGGFKEGAAETLDSGEAVKYTGVIPGSQVEAIMNESGALDSLGGSASGLTEEQLKEIFTGMEDMPVSLWIDKASGYPVKYEMDMTGAMSSFMKKMLTAMGQDETAMAIDKMVISMTCSNFDKATDFEIPAEAKG